MTKLHQLKIYDPKTDKKAMQLLDEVFVRNLFKSVTCLLSALLIVSTRSAFSEQLDSKVDNEVNDAFVGSIAGNYTKTFLSNVIKYNKGNYKVKDVVDNNSHLPPKLLAKLKKYENLALPKISMIGDNAVIVMNKKHAIVFNVETLLDGYILVNNERMNIHTIEYDYAQKLKYDEKTSWINKSILMLMDSAIAAPHDEFEVLIFSTLITIKNDFDSSYCFFQSCIDNRARKNFDLVLEEMEYLADNCNMGLKISFLTKLDGHSRTNVRDTLEKRLKKELGGYKSEELTCQRFVETFHQKEIAAVASREEKRGYFGVNSWEAEQNKEKNKQDFENYVKKVCKPYVDLRNCLVDDYEEAQAIHDRVRGSGKEGAWENYGDEYKPAKRQDPVQR